MKTMKVLVLAFGMLAACGGGGSTHGGDGMSNPSNDSMPCADSSDCPALDCGCSNGSSTSLQSCVDGECITACPSNNQKSGESCVVPGGCFCASTTCAFTTTTCCAQAGAVTSGGSCSADCDCATGICSFGQCF